MSDRMRRVNEAMREVLSDALTQDLKDPRVGFVTQSIVQLRLSYFRTSGAGCPCSSILS
jgi:ribosome-binding factor A